MRKLEYIEYLKTDYILCLVKIEYDENTNVINTGILNHYKYGILTFSDNNKEIHKWEDEDQSKSGSYLNRRYPVTLLNGVVNDKDFENDFTREVKDIINKSNLNKNDKNLYFILIDQIKQGRLI